LKEVTTYDRYREFEDLLVCPADHGPLIWLRPEGVVYNPRLLRGYPIQDGIPQLLEAESFDVDVSGRKRRSVL
jgi:uncharacterized protein YbaR (Trm112 family)